MSEFEFSPAVARALDDYGPAAAGGPDWDDVVRRTGRRRRRAPFLLVAAIAALVALSLTTPLGSAIRDTIAGFASWLDGTPGTPASPDEQRAFEESNGSWVGFPGSPQLRRLIQTDVEGIRLELFGFRSGDSLCIRVVASGAAHDSTIECAPVSDLENDDVPVRVLLADWGVGQGDKTKTIGFDTFRASLGQVTAGIAADGVSSIELTDDQGVHEVEPSSNAFLYVSPRPDVLQRVTQVRAQLVGGGSVDVPFNPALRAPSPAIGNPSGVPGGPTHIERVLEGGTIGWLERREARGEPMSSLSRGLPGGDDVEFGRVLTPDPDNGIRVALTVSRGDHGVCSWVIERKGASGGCMGREGSLFQHAPFTGGYSVAGAGAQYAVFAGVASDDVSRLAIFTSTGDTIAVALNDNAYLASVALARLPAKLVAYDTSGRVIGIEDEAGDAEAPSTPAGQPIVRLSAAAGDSSLELRALRTREGGQCWFARYKGSATGESGACIGADWSTAPLRVGWSENPPLFVYGRAREDIQTITLRYADGETEQFEPGRYGYVLYTIPPAHRERGHELIELIGRGADGKVVGQVGAR